MTATCRFCSEVIQARRIVLPAATGGGGNGAPAMMQTETARLGMAVTDHLIARHRQHLEFIQNMQMIFGGLLVNLTVTSTEQTFTDEVEKLRERMIELLKAGPQPAAPAPPPDQHLKQ